MIDMSLRPFTRHTVGSLARVYKLIFCGSMSRCFLGYFTINGVCNVRRAHMVLRSISPLDHDICSLSDLHDIVRLDPLFSLEFLLHPSNLPNDSFRYASRFSESSFVGKASNVVSDYGRMCHILGSSVCLSLIDIRAMCRSEEIGSGSCNYIIYFMRDWLFNVLHKSRPHVCTEPDDIVNCSVEVEVVLAFFFMLRSARYIYDEIEDIETVEKIGNVVHKLWRLLFSRSLEYGGSMFCFLKMVSAMSIIKSALILSSVIGGVSGTDYKEIALNNVLVCFTFTCNECNQGPGAIPCGKQIIVGSSFNNEICDAINSVVTGSSRPIKAFSSLLSSMQSTDWLDKFTWFDSPTVNILENLRRDFTLPCEIISSRCVPSLTSLAVKPIPHISIDDMHSFRTIMDNVFGACCAQRDEGMADSGICLKDAFMTVMKYYEIFSEAHMKSTKRAKWNKWMGCVVTASPHRGLSQDDVCCFIVFIVGLCIFPIHMKCMMDSSCKLRKAINSLWCSDMSDTCADCIANAVLYLCECSLFLTYDESRALKLWLKDNICVGDNSAKRPRNSLAAGFEDCYRNGDFLLPHEM